MPEFASPFDAELARIGPPAIFTADPAGRLRVDPERTREMGLVLGELPAGPPEPAHYVLTDRVTGVRMYLFVTAPVLAERQPRGDAERVPDAATAMERVRAAWAAGGAGGPAAAGAGERLPR